MEQYNTQVALLLDVIPEVAKERCFALHGGTAINLFVRDLPRLSVDIDLTYIPLESRDKSFENINLSLDNLKHNIETHVANAKINHQKGLLKLQVSTNEAQVKIEVNQGMRGILDQVEKRVLCNSAQEQFDTFCEIDVVSLGQLYGGKIVAALDRQHPRDLFDVKCLLDNEGFTEDIKVGVLFALMSSKRPIVELLFPNFIDQNQTLKNQFEGMTSMPFNYDDFKSTRLSILTHLHQSLTKKDLEFIIQFENVLPDWSNYDFQDFPAIQWKLKNLKNLKETNPEKHQRGLKHLKSKLSQIKPS